MPGLDIKKLEDYKDEILKAEIGALLFNLGKTHIGFSFWRDYFPHKSEEYKFSSYKEYPENYFYEELKNISPDLKRFFEDLKIQLEFFQSDFIELMKGRDSENNFVKKVFFKGCENINSGIDKGAPNERIKSSLWISNAFGSFKEKVEEKNFDEKRKEFFSKLNNFFELKNYYQEQNLNWKDIRNFIFKEIKDWYSHLLSDSRFPVNDVTLYDQAYMTASMFKAVLSQLIMDSSKLDDYQTNPSSIKWRILGIQYDKFGLAEKGLKLASIQWYREILEKIDEEIKKLLEVEYPIGNEIYRDETGIYFVVGENIEKLPDEIEEKIKNIFENTKLDDREIEGLKNEVSFYIALSKPSRGLMNLSTLLENANINFLKKGRINVTLEKFKTIFWKTKYINVSYEKSLLEDKLNPNFPFKPNIVVGVCPLCQNRLTYLEDKEKNNKPTICKVCDSRTHHSQVSRWIKEIENDKPVETIWLDEVKDKNNRVAYISLKFELEDWLNGNLLNSLLGNKVNYSKLIEEIKISIINEEILSEKLWNLFSNYFTEIPFDASLLQSLSLNGNDLKQILPNNEIKNIGRIIAVFKSLKNARLYNDFNLYIKNIKQKVSSLGNTTGLFESINEIVNFLESDDDIENLDKLLKNEGNGFGSLDENIEFLWNYNSIPQIKKLLDEVKNYKIYIDKAKKILKKEDKGKLPELKNLVINFIPFSISEEILNYYYQYGTLKNFYQQLFFSSIYGTNWENWLSNIDSLKEKINFQNEEIYWDSIEEDEESLNLISTLLLQFLLRKNPSPARLRRIWETTRDFFEDIHKDLDNILKVPEWRKKRLVWEIDLNENNKLNKSMELEAGELLFWAEKINDSKAKIYLISSIRDFLLKFGKSNIKKQVVESNNDLLNEKMENLKENIVEKELVLKPYNSTNDEENNIKITTSDFSEIKEYKPFAKITDPSPKNYQIVIPAEYLEKFIDKVMERYDKEFKYVYGKLPLHIGIVVSHYKKPTYVNLKALRKIRRDVENISFLRKKLRWDKFRNVYTLKLKNASRKYREDFIKEIKNRTHIYYSLYWFNLDKKDYNFYVKPDKFGKKWLAFHTKFRKNRDNRITYYPNTFDFEFMDTNTRRNDIFYDENKKYKRVIKRKSNRPYEIEKYWEKFKAFKELVSDKNYQRSRLFKIIETIYPKLPEIENIETDYSYMFAPVFYRYLDLNDRNRRKIFKKIFSIDENLNSQEYLEKLRETLSDTTNLYLFLDMFEFWHTMLKEV